LRACEIAGVTLADVTDAEGKLSPWIRVRGKTAKNGRARTIPMHPLIAEAISALRARHPDIDRLAISSRYGEPLRSQNAAALATWFHRLYPKAGLQGCSSHSGRRTFGTTLARSANMHGSSLRDVQQLLGHARLDTTEKYIEPAENLMELVASLGAKPTRAAPRSNQSKKANLW
jgi:integrase/recombinase XerD